MRNLNPTSANRSGQSLMRVFAALLALVGAFAIGTFALRGNASALAQLPPLAESPGGTIDLVQMQSPVVNPLAVGTPFQIQFRLQNVSAAAQDVNSVAIHFNFDPTILQVATIANPDPPPDFLFDFTPNNSQFPTTLTAEFNNTLGQVNYVVGSLVNPPPQIAVGSTTLRVVTIKFVPIACSLNTTISYVFNVGTPRDTIVAGPAGQLLRDAVDTSYVIPGAACAGATATTAPATATSVPATATTVPATATTVPATATTVPATATTVPATATTVPATATATTIVASPTASATATATTVVASPTASATATATTVVASPTASATATATEVPPTATAVPATATAVPATATQVPATATAVADPTATTVPATATQVPATATEVVPTATLVIVTNTLTPVIATNTPVPGTATATLSGVDLTATAGAGGSTAIPGTATATAVAPTAGTCGLPIPSGSVVGGMPFGAQAFWAPGKLIQPSLMVNPGSYWVIGQDASETYYNILIACAFVWVRKDTMGPYSDGKNWFNNPLPTRIVS